MVHAPQFGLFHDPKRRVIQNEMDSLFDGMCVSCGDDLEYSDSIAGRCRWCFRLSHIYGRHG